MKDACLKDDHNIGSYQVGWHRESNEHRNCQTVTLTDDFIEDPMLLEKKCPQSEKPKC